MRFMHGTKKLGQLQTSKAGHFWWKSIGNHPEHFPWKVVSNWPVTSGVLFSCTTCLMSHVRSAPEIRKGVFFCNYFFLSSLHGLTWHLHLIDQELTSHSRGGEYRWHTGPMWHVIFDQALKQENDKILHSSVNFLCFFLFLWWAPSMMRPHGRGRFEYPISF